jgi:hypothetical protein
MMKTNEASKLARVISKRRGGLSTVALFIASLVTLSAFTLLVISLLFAKTIDTGRVIIFALTTIILGPTLFKSSRESLKTFARRMIHRGPPGGDLVELNMGEMHYFVAGEEKDVLVINGNGTCWGRGFLVISKALPQTRALVHERRRSEEHRMLDVFIESAYSNKLPLQSIMSLSPINEEEVINDTPDALGTPPEVIARMDENKQLSLIQSKLGVWQSRMIMSTRSSTKPPSRVAEVIEEVHAKLSQLRALFTAAFPDYVVEKAAGRREMRKIATFMLTHSEGSNLIRDGGGITALSGKELKKFVSIPRLLRNSVPESFPYKQFQLNPQIDSDVFLGNILDDAGNPTTRVGLKICHLKRGIAIFGEQQDQLDLTNKTIVSKLATSSTPYIIFTRDTKYRALMNLVPDAIVVELGERFTINPLDREDTDPEQYIPLVLNVFENSFPVNDEQANMLHSILHDVYSDEAPPTLTLLKDHAENISSSGKESYARTRILEGIVKTLTTLLGGNAGAALSGSSTVQFRKLLEGASPLIIIEFKGITDPTVIRFIEGMILAKLYALYAGRTDSLAVYGERMLLLEEADLLFKSASLRYIRRAVSPAETLSKWVYELSKCGVGLHISTRSPGQLDDSILTRIGTRITHRITMIEDAAVAAKCVGLEPQTLTSWYQATMKPIISYLPNNEALLFRPDTKKPFLLRIAGDEVLGLPDPNDSDIFDRMSDVLRPETTNLNTPLTQLGIDYPDAEDRRIAKEVLELLEEYTDFGKGSVTCCFEKEEEQKVKALLPELEHHRYIITTLIELGGGKLRRVYRLTEKGKKALDDQIAIENSQISPAASASEDHLREGQKDTEGDSSTKLGARLRPVFAGAIGGLRMARKLFKADKFGLALQRINETLARFLTNLSEKQETGVELQEEDTIEDILRSLSDSGVPLPRDGTAITWIGELAIESIDGQAPVAREQALRALQDAVSFLKEAATIFHIE